MKKLKRILAILMTMAMVLGMTVTAFAAENPDTIVGTRDDRGDIVVSGVEQEDGTNITVKAYPIAMATYDANGNFSGYSNEWGIADLEKPTAAELSNIAAGKKANGSETKALPTAIEMEYDTTNNNYKKENVAVGMYLVMVEGSEASTYNPAVVSVNYKNEEGVNVLENGAVSMIADGDTWVKKSGTPKVDKVIGDTQDTGDEDSTGNVGDTVPYTVTINPVPSYEGNYPKLNVVDTLSAGLTYVPDSLKVRVTPAVPTTKDNPATEAEGKLLTEGTDYTLTVAGQTITVDFVVNGKYTLNNYHGQVVTINYGAKINENAKLNEIANENHVVLNYTKDSKTTGHDGTDDDRTYTYVFDIDGKLTGSGSTGSKENVIDTTHIINKLGEEIAKTETMIEGETVYKDTKLPLKDAEFKLYTDEECENVYSNPNFTGTVLSSELGQLHMTGLEAGKYYLKETKAPEGYSVNTHVYEIEISYEADEAGVMTSWNVTIDGDSIATFTVDYTTANDGTVTVTVTRGNDITKEEDSSFQGLNIRNTKLANLPSTGGIGTYIFTIAGIIIMAAAAGFFFVSRRKAEK